MPATNLARGVPQIPDAAKFIDFAPDADNITPGILLDCGNVYPIFRGFRSYPSLVRYSSNDLPSTCFGTFSGPHGNQNIIVAGVGNQLYELSTTAWISGGISPSVITYPSRWRFDMYGTDLVAVNGINRPYVRPLSSAWALLGGTPPVASIVAASDYSLFLIETNSNHWWSSLSDVLWNPSVATQTVEDNLDETSGNITAAHKLRGGMALYKRKSLAYSQFIGPPFYWDFNNVSEQIGAPSQEAVANIGDTHYFLGPDDFYQFDGQSLQRIPNNLKEWFFENYDQTKDYLVCTRWDQQKSLIFWHFASIAAVGDSIDQWICFNQRTGRWSKGDELIEMPIFSAIQTGNLTYLVFTTTYPTYADVNGLVYGDLRSRAIDVSGVIKAADHGLYLYNGQPGISYVTTHDWGDRHNMYQCTRMRPHFSKYPTAGASLQVFEQSNPGETPVAGLTSVLSSDGWFNFVNTARLQRFKMTFNSEMEIVGCNGLLEYAGER